jgi:hypothetical protein
MVWNGGKLEQGGIDIKGLKKMKDGVYIIILYLNHSLVSSIKNNPVFLGAIYLDLFLY